MKIFEDIINNLDIDEDNFDLIKMKDIYNILSPISFEKETDIMVAYNKIINLFWNDRFNNKEIIFINKILSYLHILVDINNNFEDIDLQINYHKYNRISLEVYDEILSYKIKLENNLNFDLYIILWNKFLNYKNLPIIERQKEYYNLESDDSYYIINKKIISEYMKTKKIKTLNNKYKIDNHISLFFLLITDKI
jgi:hypothetical protein